MVETLPMNVDEIQLAIDGGLAKSYCGSDFSGKGNENEAKKSTHSHLPANPARFCKRASGLHVCVSMRGFQPTNSQAERLPLARAAIF
jgi:hypothetical protein